MCLINCLAFTHTMARETVHKDVVQSMYMIN
jgi:hypothetical protein